MLEHVHACRHPEKYDDPHDETKKRSSEERLTPIIGVEAYWRPDRFMELTDKNVYGKNPSGWAQHLCLHAASLKGWHTLLRLSSKSWVRKENGGGFYNKPCIDWDMLEEDSEDIIVSTACMQSPLSHLILAGDERGARRWLKDMREIVGDRLWIELMPHDMDEQRTLNVDLWNLGQQLSIPCIGTGDVHMPYKSWASTRLVVMMAATRQSFASREKKREGGEDVYGDEADTLYLSSGEEMRDMFLDNHPDLPEEAIEESLSNTDDFTKQVKWYVIGKKDKLPRVSATPKEAYKTIKRWCEDGFDIIDENYPDDHWDQWSRDSYTERFEMEIEVLKRKGVLDYFVLVGDLVRWAKSTESLPLTKDDPEPQLKKPIRVGLGRGSAAGCLVSYLIGITAIDPIPHRLLFERFLNPDREGLPDIDLDFDPEYREVIKEYLRRTYGQDHVADIIAYQTFAPRAVIGAVSDVYDVDFKERKKITDSIGDTERGLEKIAKDNPVVAKYKKQHDDVWGHCLRLEDQILRDSRHAGGVVITDKATNYYMPTQLGSDEESTVTAWADRAEFPVVSDYGFVKLDVLGITGLTKQELTVELIEKHYDEIVEPNDLPALRNPYDTDQQVIDAFTKGFTVGVFQFGGGGITQLLRHIKPDSTIDISVANALYRPGPIKIAHEYADRKNGKTPVTYWHDSLEPVLNETLGLIAFQEQVMEITKRVGNFTGGDADSMRKAISKMYRLPGNEARIFMEQWREKWTQGCRDNSLKDNDADLIWERILEFAGYGFNRSHSSSYALQAYQDMWLKIHYPLPFYAATLTIEKKDKRPEQEAFLKAALREARIFEIDALGPNINESERGWTISDNAMRYGLVSINDMGGKAADDIVKERDEGEFETYDDFVERMPSGFGVGNNVALAMGGAFDDIAEREHLLSKVRNWPETTAKLKAKMTCKCKKQRTVKFDDVDDKDSAIETSLLAIECKNHPDAEMEEWEELDPFITLARYAKDHPGEDPEVVESPSQNQLMAMENEALNIPLSMASVLSDYKDFIEERIFTEEEFDDLPAKPKRKKSKGQTAHGNWCECEECEAAHCVIGGEIASIKVITTKQKKEQMAFVEVAFGVNRWSCTIFPSYYRQFREILHSPSAILLAGHKDDRGQMLVYDVQDVIKVADDMEWKPPIDASDVADIIDKKPPRKKTKFRIKTKVIPGAD